MFFIMWCKCFALLFFLERSSEKSSREFLGLWGSCSLCVCTRLCHLPYKFGKDGASFASVSPRPHRTVRFPAALCIKGKVSKTCSSQPRGHNGVRQLCMCVCVHVSVCDKSSGWAGGLMGLYSWERFLGASVLFTLGWLCSFHIFLFSNGQFYSCGYRLHTCACRRITKCSDSQAIVFDPGTEVWPVHVCLCVCMCECLYMYVWVLGCASVHVCAYTCVRMHVQICVNVCVCVTTRTYMCAHASVCAFDGKCVNVSACVCMWVLVCVHVGACMYILIHMNVYVCECECVHACVCACI